MGVSTVKVTAEEKEELSGGQHLPGGVEGLRSLAWLLARTCSRKEGETTEIQGRNPSGNLTQSPQLEDKDPETREA